MKYLARIVLLPAILCFNTYASDSSENVVSLGTEKNPFAIDASRASPTTETRSHPKGIGQNIYFRVYNVKPKDREKYLASAESTPVQIQPLPNKTIQEPKPDKDGGGETSGDDRKDTGEKSGSEAIADLCPAQLDPLKVKLDAAETKNADIPKIVKDIEGLSVCTDEQKKEVISKTEVVFFTTYNPEEDLEFTVSFVKNNVPEKLATYKFKGETKQWLVHTGWTFIDSKDSEYYSLKGDDDSYTISRKNSQTSWNHALTVMYTYPYHTKWDKVQWGPTGILGLGQNGLLVGGGVSLVVAENIVLNAAIVATEFERLNGVYTPGQNIGTQPLDSSSLNEKKIMASWAITIGFKFN